VLKMKKKLIGLNLKRKKFKFEAFVVPFWRKGIGLMFQRREKAKILIFEFKSPVKMAIHSWFVFFPFFAIWLDSKNRVLDYKIIMPFKFKILPSKKFVKLIEVPINNKYKVLGLPSIKERFK